MKEGSINEEQALLALASFFDSNIAYKARIAADRDEFDLSQTECRKLRIDHKRSVGLVESNCSKMLADSPDGVLGFVTETGDSHFSAVEVKTMTIPSTIEKAKELMK